MIPYKAPLGDILFSLEHVANAGQLPHCDLDLLTGIGEHFAALAEGEFAPINAPGDRQGASLSDGRVTMPDGFKQAYDAYAEQGWPGLTVPEDFGGQGLGGVELALTSEIFSGANHSLQMVTGLVPGAVRTVLQYGTEAQKAEVLPKLATGEWLSTMALTEPGAGSDLSRIKCRAIRDGTCWKISGEKIFISGGDQDLSAGILHLVLARTSGDGLRGLSLFICKSHLDDGSRNSVSVTRIEEKLGLHASPTCQMTFNEATAELIGAEGDGLKAMFTMMNHARLDVALQGAAHAARVADIARAYASERVQGKDLTIDQHPDVRRMLDEIDLRAVGARGVAHLALGALERGGEDDLAQMLTPVAKVFATEVATEAADLGIQVLGGYGYLEEYGVAQIWRDARICRIYEGANGIHALSLVTRLVRLGAPLDAFDSLISTQERLESELADWRSARDDVAAMEDPRAAADAFMNLTAELAHAFVWTRLGEVAELHADPARIRRLAERAKRRYHVRLLQYNAEGGK